jgi:formylglycine-generating enzyme required for sulfatase activity
VQTTWNDAQAFCGWLANKSGRAAGLPTEAQWEYACRAGTTTAYPWGDDPDAGKGWANCADRRLKSLTVNDTQANYYFGWDDGFAFTSPVGSFTPNAFGLCDMLGNAMQWCQDVRGDYDTGAVTDPVQAATAKNGAGRRVVRGGSWVDGLPDCRAAYRFEFKPDYRDECSGFRVAATAGAE